MRLLLSRLVQAILAFAAALVAFRLAGALVRRWRTRHAPELAAWAGSLLAYALACAALAWGAAAGWDARAFRAYYLFGGLLTAPLLGVGSLLRAGVRWIGAVGLAYVGLAVGVAVAVPVSGAFSGSGIPPAQDHLDLFPARLLAIVGNGAGTLAAVAVAVLTIRRRLLGNALVVAGLAVAAAGSALVGLGEAGTAAVFAAAACLLYLGFSVPAGWRLSSSSSSKSDR
jgi:hypothetical protein